MQRHGAAMHTDDKETERESNESNTRIARAPCLGTSSGREATRANESQSERPGQGSVKEFPVRIVGLHTVLIIAAAYLLFGLVGHDPWKPDEAYVFGIAYHFLVTPGDWLIPTLAGEPFVEKPPLMYWTAAAFARAFSAWMPLHDGARLAVGWYMAITCAATAWVARYWWGNGFGRIAVLALISCLGLFIPAHTLLTDVPVLTGLAVATCGIAVAGNQALVGGLLLGTGVGVGFMAKGLIAPGVIGVTWILLLIFFSTWRTRNILIASVVGVFAALPWLLIWPSALYLRSPSLFMEWFWSNNIGRFIGFSVPMLGAANVDGFWWHTILWFTFPILPLALMTFWRSRAELLDSPPIQVCLLMSLVIASALAISASARENYFVPLLLPLCLLAAPAALSLNTVEDKYLDWSARAVFGVLTIVIWTVWIAMVVQGLPPRVPILVRWLPVDFSPHTNPQAIILAAILTVMAVTAIGMRRVRPRGLVSWAVGMTLVLGLLSTLWLSWIDEAKSYRVVFESMKLALGTKYNCVASTGLDESELGMLHYVVNVVPRTNGSPVDCDFWFHEASTRLQLTETDERHWALVWEGARPGDLQERFFLFKARERSN